MVKMKYPDGWEDAVTQARRTLIEAEIDYVVLPCPIAAAAYAYGGTGRCPRRERVYHALVREAEKVYEEQQQAWLARVLAEPPMTLETYYERMEATHPDYHRPLPKGRKPNKKDVRIAELEAEVKRLKARLAECVA